MKQFSTGFRKVLAFLMTSTWFAAFSGAMFMSSHRTAIGLGPGILVFSFAWYFILLFCDFKSKDLWLRCYCEIAVVQALQDKTPILDLIENKEAAELRPNLLGLIFGGIMYALSIIPATSSFGFAVAIATGVIYLCMILCVSLRCLAAYRHNIKNHSVYVPTRQVERPHQNWPDESIVQYEAISVADLHQIFSSALKEAKRRL